MGDCETPDVQSIVSQTSGGIKSYEEKHMKKKIYALLMIVMLVLLAAGCGKKGKR